MDIHRFIRLALFSWLFVAYPILSLPRPKPMFASVVDGGRATASFKGGAAAKSAAEMAGGVPDPHLNVALESTHTVADPLSSTGPSANPLVNLRKTEIPKPPERPVTPEVKPPETPPEPHAGTDGPQAEKLAEAAKASRLAQLKKISGDGFAYLGSQTWRGLRALGKAIQRGIRDFGADGSLDYLYRNSRTSLSVAEQEKKALALKNTNIKKMAAWFREKIGSKEAHPSVAEAGGHAEEGSMAAKHSEGLENSHAVEDSKAAKSSDALEDTTAAKNSGSLENKHVPTAAEATKGEESATKALDKKPPGMMAKVWNFIAAPFRSIDRVYTAFRVARAEKVVYGSSKSDRLAAHVLERFEAQGPGFWSRMKTKFPGSSNKVKTIDAEADHAKPVDAADATHNTAV
ncbi:hypothetical protein PGT21_012156 [Puccinia graminis f. sp. tritici]|uniref:Uncharacterized protein n=1 Tax=Puccinia graminis f. sp. tritici TaxID=56615 RepID=A0A5B0NVB1_PUCGR|nr:hypothetical protein PGT21_012156 [Puccinia graminis f. sp. tritici]